MLMLDIVSLNQIKRIVMTIEQMLGDLHNMAEHAAVTGPKPTNLKIKVKKSRRH